MVLQYRMFRTPGSCKRYEHVSIQLDTPVVLPGDGVRQQKNGYQFTLNGRSSYFDWYNANFYLDFKVNKLADGRNHGKDAQKAMINDVASLITELQIKQNEKIIYDGNKSIYNNQYKEPFKNVILEQMNTFI